MDLFGQKGVIHIGRRKFTPGYCEMGNMSALAHICSPSIQPGRECSYRLMVSIGYDLWVDIAYFKVFIC